MKENKQLSLFDQDGKKRSKKPEGPATEVMKIVAAKTTIEGKKLEKSFSKNEIDEILAKRESGSPLEKAETIRLRTEYRRIKRLVKEMEAGNQQKIIVFPSLTSGDKWYKVIEFSALYYVYRLAPRMGRRAKIYNDSDKHSQALFSASFQNIEKFIEQFERLENPKVDKTEDGVYIFTLKNPVSDEELTLLRHAEEARREKMHNILRPARMNPAVFQQILLISRQVVPRARKLKKEYYNTTGEEMVRDVQEMLTLYFGYSRGVYEKAEMFEMISKLLDKMTAGVTVLSENRIWGYEIAVVIGTGIADLRTMIEKDLGVKKDG